MASTSWPSHHAPRAACGEDRSQTSPIPEIRFNAERASAAPPYHFSCMLDPAEPWLPKAWPGAMPDRSRFSHVACGRHRNFSDRAAITTQGARRCPDRQSADGPVTGLLPSRRQNVVPAKATFTGESSPRIRHACPGGRWLGSPPHQLRRGGVGGNARRRRHPARRRQPAGRR